MKASSLYPILSGLSLVAAVLLVAMPGPVELRVALASVSIIAVLAAGWCLLREVKP